MIDPMWKERFKESVRQCRRYGRNSAKTFVTLRRESEWKELSNGQMIHAIHDVFAEEAPAEVVSPVAETSDPLAAQLFRRFFPLMRRVLERDPYATMGVELAGFQREGVEAGGPPINLGIVLTVRPSGFEAARVPAGEHLTLTVDETDGQLDAIFEEWSPTRAPHPPATKPPGPRQTRRSTPALPVPLPVCARCYVPLEPDWPCDICAACGEAIHREQTGG